MEKGNRTDDRSSGEDMSDDNDDKMDDTMRDRMNMTTMGRMNYTGMSLFKHHFCVLID